MGTANVRIVPGLLDIAYRPGNPFDVRLIGWPPGSLTGRTFETRLGTVTFDTDVVGDTIEIHGTTDQTTAAGAILQRVLTIVDTATDQVLLTGQATASYDGGGITNGIVRVQIGPVDVVVELIDLSGGAAGVSAQLAAHIDATTGAHPASAITAVPVGGLTGDDVAEQLAELDTRATAIETAGPYASEGDVTAAVAAEATARSAADTAEATARAAAVSAEATARAIADGLLIPLAQKGAASGVAPLGVDGKLATSFLPALAINDTFTVGSQAAMLALTAQRGDVAVRTDLTPAGFFLLTSDSPGTLADWKQILAPGAVVTVDGRSGAVSLADLYDPAGAAATVAGNLTAEAAARSAADNGLDGRLDAIEAVGPLASTAALDAAVLSLSEDIGEGLGELQASVDGVGDDLTAEIAALPGIYVAKSAEVRTLVPITFSVQAGAPTFIGTGGVDQLSAMWAMHHGATESLLVDFAPPIGATAIDVDFWWWNTTAGAGSVNWRVAVLEFTNGATNFAFPVNGDSGIVAKVAPAQNVQTLQAAFLSNVTISASPNKRYTLFIERRGLDAGDTLAGVAGLSSCVVRPH